MSEPLVAGGLRARHAIQFMPHLAHGRVNDTPCTIHRTQRFVFGKIVAPKVGGAKLADGSMLAVDGQLAGMPSVLFDAIAVILSDAGAKALSMESAAIDFVRDAFGHLKAIAVDHGGQALLQAANVAQDAGVMDANDKDVFIAAAKTRQWEREKFVRMLA